MNRRKITLRWTCSNYVHHEHKFRWIAFICGKFQQLLNGVKNEY